MTKEDCCDQGVLDFAMAGIADEKLARGLEGLGGIIDDRDAYG